MKKEKHTPRTQTSLQNARANLIMLLICRSSLNRNRSLTQQGNIFHLALILGRESAALDDIDAVEKLASDAHADNWMREVPAI